MDLAREDLLEFFLHQAQPIHPAFPNWQKSFVSGPNSPLFTIEHRIEIQNSIRLISRIQFKDLAEGPPGHVHGGASAALIDETMGVAVWHNEYSCVTQNLNLRYIKTLPMNLDAFVITEIADVRDRTIDVNCTIYNKKLTPYVSAQGVFHRLTPNQLQKFIESKPL